MKTVIKLENISKKYAIYDKNIYRIKEAFSIKHKSYHKDFYALKDVSFSVKEGEIVGIVGRNGAGKSTLLKTITGIIEPTCGTIFHEGKITALLELGTGFNMEYTGIENILTVGMLSGFTREEMKHKVDSIVEFAELGDFIYQPVKNYSSGMFARLAFALSINVDPDILIVDEALSVGDMHFQLKCMDKFNEFREKGKTILFVTHDVHSVKRFCSRAIWMNEGHIIDDGEVNKVTDEYLDFLKIETSEEIKTHEKSIIINDEKTEIQMDKIDKKVGDLAYISDFKLYNSAGEETEIIKYGEKISVKIDYNLCNYSDENLVIGVAILRVDNMYVCGLNTFLDKITVDTNKKHGHIMLEYASMDLMPGTYYFDCGLMEKNAYVNLDYKTKIKEFKVISDYIGEGIVILKHEWKFPNKE